MVRELKQKANDLFNRGKFRKSRLLYESAIALDAEDPQLQLRLAECCKREGDFGAASKALECAADLFIANGYDARAAAALRLALDVRPNDPDVRAKLAQVERRRGFTLAEESLTAKLLDAAEDRFLTPERFSNSARALSLEEIPIIVDDAQMVAAEAEAGLDPVTPKSTELPNLVRLSEHEFAVRTSDTTWTILRSATGIRREEISEEAFWARNPFSLDAE